MNTDGWILHHLGVACADLDAEAAPWLALGWSQEGPEFTDPVQGVRGRFLVGPGPRLELLCPSQAGSRIDGLVAKGVKIYHQAFVVADLEAAAAAVRSVGGRATAPPAPAPAFSGRRVVFLMLPNLNLIECVEGPLP